MRVGGPRFTGPGQTFFVSALKARWIGKAPVQSPGDPGENGTTLGAGFVTNGDGVGKHLSGFIDVEDRFGRAAGGIDSDFLHGFDHDGVEVAWLKTRAFRLEFFASEAIEERLGHLASGAVVNADEQDFLFHSVRLRMQSPISERSASLLK